MHQAPQVPQLPLRLCCYRIGMLRAQSLLVAKSWARPNIAPGLAFNPLHQSRIAAFDRTHRTSVRSMSEEGKSAQESVKTGAPQQAEAGEVTLFDKIVSKQIPATILYEDETALAFKDINPQAPIHFLVIPKNRDGLTQLSKATERHEALLGHLFHIASKVALQEGCDKGFRVVTNDGVQGCQSVYHLHLHVFGGKQLGWPPC